MISRTRLVFAIAVGFLTGVLVIVLLERWATNQGWREITIRAVITMLVAAVIIASVSARQRRQRAS